VNSNSDKKEESQPLKNSSSRFEQYCIMEIAEEDSLSQLKLRGQKRQRRFSVDNNNNNASQTISPLIYKQDRESEISNLKIAKHLMIENQAEIKVYSFDKE
jgi:hypothetical protein